MSPARQLFVTALLAFTLLFPVGVTVYFYCAHGRMMPWAYLFVVVVLFGFSHAVASSVRELQIVRINPTGVTWENNRTRFICSILSHTAMIVGFHIIFAWAIMNTVLAEG